MTTTNASRWVLLDPGSYGSEYSHTPAGNGYSYCGLSLTDSAPEAAPSVERCGFCQRDESYPPCN